MSLIQPIAPLRRKEVSLYLKQKYNISRTPGTLAKLAVLGGGPAFIYVGRVPMYPVEELDAWVASLSSALVKSTTHQASIGSETAHA